MTKVEALKEEIYRESKVKKSLNELIDEKKADKLNMLILDDDDEKQSQEPTEKTKENRKSKKGKKERAFNHSGHENHAAEHQHDHRNMDWVERFVSYKMLRYYCQNFKSYEVFTSRSKTEIQ